MSQPDRSARPSQVTVAGWAVAVASVLLVVAVFDTMGQLDSVDMRERLTKAISSGSAKDLGFTVGDITEILRWCLYVSGVAAAASGILGVFVLQGHRGARIALTVASVSIVLTASVAGSFPGFLGMLIGVGTALLWTRPARDWFAGRPITPRSPAEPAARVETPTSEQPAPPVAWSPPAPGTTQPPPTTGWGQAPSSVGSPVPFPPTSTAWPAPTTQPVGGPFPAAPMPPLLAARPSQVRLACILTWVFSGLTALGYLAVLVMLLVAPDQLIDRLKDSSSWPKSFDEDTVTGIATVASAIFTAWSLAAIALAVLVWRGVRWAWVLLLVSAWTAGLVGVLAFPFSLPHLAAIGASTGMLMRRPTRAWFAGQHYPQRYPPQPPAGPRPPVW